MTGRGGYSFGKSETSPMYIYGPNRLLEWPISRHRLYGDPHCPPAVESMSERERFRVRNFQIFDFIGISTWRISALVDTLASRRKDIDGARLLILWEMAPESTFPPTDIIIFICIPLIIYGAIMIIIIFYIKLLTYYIESQHKGRRLTWVRKRM